MVDSLYNETVLDHYKNPRNRGVLEAADFSHEDAGSVCGDEVRIDVRVKGDRVAEVAFSGRGCAVSQASASVLTELLANLALDDVKALSEDDLLAAIGVPIGPVRLECALLALWVLRAGMSRAGSTTGTALPS